MDINTIATSVIALLSPYLVKAGEEVAKQVGNAAWTKVTEIHQLIKARFKAEKDDYPARTLEQFEKDPERRKGAMQDVLVEILEKDPELVQSLVRLLKETAKADSGFITQIFGGEVDEIFNIDHLEGGLKIDKRSGK